MCERVSVPGILLEIQQSLGNVMLKNWQTGSDPCNNWQGVTCSGGAVIGL